MNDLEVKIRDALRRHEGDAPSFDPSDVRRMAGRTRRRQILNVGALGIGTFALVIGLVAGLGGFVRADRGQIVLPAGSPSGGTPSPNPFAERFDSPLHGLSIGYPYGWQTRAATEPWGHGAIAFDASDVDVIFDPTLREDLYLALVSEPLDGRSGHDWVNAMMSHLEPLGVCNGGGGGGNDTLHGHYGWFWSCGRGQRTILAIVETATRGYIICLHVGDDVPMTYPVPDFEGAAFEVAPEGGVPTGLLETLDLRPEDALDASSPSVSP
jgi:hypothetical protein